MPATTLESISQAVIRCTNCPELRAYCERVAREKRRAYRESPYWGKPVPAFGDPRARLLLVGLAPGAHGSNRTGRMFTGDASGDFLFPALFRAGFADRPDAVDAADGLQLHDCLITAAARCAPPGNAPTPVQLRRCRPYLDAEIAALPRLRVIVGLGAVGTAAAAASLREGAFTLEPARLRFGHGAHAVARSGARRIHLLASYHPSRQNTNTGKLTAPMFDAIFTQARALLDD